MRGVSRKSCSSKRIGNANAVYDLGGTHIFRPNQVAPGSVRTGQHHRVEEGSTAGLVQIQSRTDDGRRDLHHLKLPKYVGVNKTAGANVLWSSFAASHKAPAGYYRGDLRCRLDAVVPAADSKPYPNLLIPWEASSICRPIALMQDWNASLNLLSLLSRVR